MYSSLIYMYFLLLKVPMLLAGPSLVFALQRDNAVLSFDSILGR